MMDDGNQHGNRSSGLAISFDRRGFLRLGATLGAGLLLPDTIGCGDDPVRPPPPNLAVAPELVQPAWVRSQDRLLDIEVMEGDELRQILGITPPPPSAPTVPLPHTEV